MIRLRVGVSSKYSFRGNGHHDVARHRNAASDINSELFSQSGQSGHGGACLFSLTDTLARTETALPVFSNDFPLVQ